MILTEEQLVEKCAEWQEILKLQEWQVAISKAHPHQFGLKENQGECSWVLKKKMALIKILHEDDYPDTPFKQDMEVTLVHELLHLHYAPFDETKSGSLEEIALEQSIHLISKALVSLKRGGCKCSS